MASDVREICCCDALWSSVDKGDVVYDNVLKWFGFYTKDDPFKSYQVMRHCPFCGTKLPNLGFKYEEVIEQELGENSVPEGWFSEDRKHLPPEFQTDEWWRKRGL
jgi:hypothetical protein